MNNPRVRNIKRQQKESQLLRIISKLFTETAMDHPELLGLSLNRVELSPDKGFCFVYFWTPGGVEEFRSRLEHLKLFKPSLRKAIAQEINSRYVPDLRFKFDAIHEKQQHIESLLDDVKTDVQDSEVLRITPEDLDDLNNQDDE